MINKCLICKSKNITKKGRNTDDRQRYFCKNCKKYFQPKIELPSWVKKAYNDYAFKGMIYKDLTIKYNKSIPTLVKYFDILNNESNKINKNNKQQLNKSNNKQPINLIFDATFFKRKQSWQICF